MQEIKVIAFDADDTLWDNQVFYDEVESEFCRLLSEYGTAEEVSSRLFDIEMENMDIYKYGAKPFTLSMVEAGSRDDQPQPGAGRSDRTHCGDGKRAVGDAHPSARRGDGSARNLERRL